MKLFRRKQQQPELEITTGSKIPLKHVFTESGGVKWYEFENPLTMPAKRAIAAEVATRLAEMNITKDVMIQLIAKMKEHANEGDIVALFSILNEIEFRMNYAGEEETLIELAACYFVREGEDETTFDELQRRKKIEMLKSDSALFSFFVQRAFELTMNYSNISQTDIQDYLIRNAQNNEKLLRLIRNKQ
jgi:hypothetical protein